MLKSRLEKTFFLVLAISLLIVFSTTAQTNIMERKRLFELLEERRQKFDAYSASIEKHSGIFGNKTKKDMQKSNDVLTELVRTDNNIISVLNRAVDFKNYERVSLSQEVGENTQQMESLLHATDTLERQLVKIRADQVTLKRESQWLKIVNRTLIFAVLMMIFLFVRKKKQS